MTKRDLEAVGLHSLFWEDDRNGTDRERHVTQVDIDSHEPLRNPRKFREDALRAMRAHGLMDLYLFETRKGVHAWSPWLQSRRFAERFEVALGHDWKGDDFHAQMGWKNGGTVLRFTPKPGEGDVCDHRADSYDDGDEHVAATQPTLADCERCFGTGWTGPRYVAHIRLDAKLLAPWSFWSKTHYDFMAARYALPEHVRPLPLDRAVECAQLRTERYFTYAPNSEPTA